MNRRKGYSALLVGLLILFCAATAYAATYQQGYCTGCEIAQGVYGNTNDYFLMRRTVILAESHGEFDYAEGVEDGYWACASGGTGGPL